MATPRVTPPEPFDFSTPDEWPRWLRRFQRYSIASGLTSGDEEMQVNTLMYCMGDKADDILRSFQLSPEDEKKYDVVRGKFDDYFVARRNVIYERAKFNSRRQEQGEPVEAFVTALYSLAEHCGYGTLHDEMIRDRIVVGIQDQKLSEKLQLDASLTLEKAVAMVRQAEAVRRQQSVIRGDTKNNQDQTDSPVQAIHGTPQQRPSTTPQQACPWCGKSPAHERRRCPARGVTCHRCSKKGHFQKVCRAPARARPVQLEDQEPEPFLGEIRSHSSPNSWTVTLKLNGTPTELLIDTGAEVTVISEETHNSIGSPPLTVPFRSLKGPSNHSLQVKGFFSGCLKIDTKETRQDIYVVKQLHKQLLGRPAIEALGLAIRTGAVTTHSQGPWEEFPSLFKGLGKLNQPYTIKLHPDATPFSQSVVRRVAIPLMQPVKEELERMEQLGVIARVEQPTDWCAGLVVVQKPNGKVRICVDLTKLNESVRRERHPLPAVDQVLAQLSGATIFSKLDANSGFWQVPLSPESALLTTFITPFGRFCFHRLPFGISSAPEIFQRVMSQMLTGLPGTVCMMDDVLVFGATQEEHDDRLRGVLRRIQDSGMTLNPEKCEFSRSRVKFLGHVVDKEGIRPDPDKIQGIVQTATPKDISDVRRFLGTVNQMSKFTPCLADSTRPLRELLERDSVWHWGDKQQRAFDSIKVQLTSAPVLALFDPKRETILSADASSYGIGAVLLQKQENGELKPVAYKSRALTPTEQRYAQIEKEALAFTWACDSLADYLLGLQFHIQTDHKPLVPLFGSKKNLDELPPRLQRFRLRMMRYSFSISHVPGKSLTVADALSRAPSTDQQQEDLDFQREADFYVSNILRYIPATEQRVAEIKHHQQQDSVCKQLMDYCLTQWPAKKDLSEEVRPYYSVAQEMSVVDGLLLRGTRLVIPPTMRRDILNRLHTGHLGITKCRERARQTVWWPGLSAELERTIKNCHECCKHQKQHAEPLCPSPLPDLPFQKVGTDLFEWEGKQYLLVVDYYSRFVEIAKLAGSTATEVITHTKGIFARHGIPELVISDNGPQYSSAAYTQFARDYGFRHVTSSPLYPQGNGEAERAVRTVKELLRKQGDPYLALLAYRATPLQCGYSPAELLMSRRLRTTVPATRESLMPGVPDRGVVKKRDQQQKLRQENNFNDRRGARALPHLDLGSRVWVPDRASEAEVVGQTNPRSYQVVTPEGTYRRNRRALCPLPTIPVTADTELGPEQASQNDPQEPPEQTPAEPTSSNERTRQSNRNRCPPDRLDPSWT